MKFLLHFILLLSHFYSIGQEVKTFIPGSEKPIKTSCNKSCKIDFVNYVVTTKEGEDFIGQTMSLYIKKSGKKLAILPDDETCFFDGVYKNYIILNCGTDVIRGYIIFDIQKNIYFEVPGGVLSISEIKNDNLYLDIQMTDKRKMSYKLKDRYCETHACGYYEKVVFNLVTQKLVYTGKYYWLK